MFEAFFPDSQYWDEIEKIYQPIVGSKLQEIFLNNDPIGAFTAIAALVTTNVGTP